MTSKYIPWIVKCSLYLNFIPKWSVINPNETAYIFDRTLCWVLNIFLGWNFKGFLNSCDLRKAVTHGNVSKYFILHEIQPACFCTEPFRVDICSNCRSMKVLVTEWRLFNCLPWLWTVRLWSKLYNEIIFKTNLKLVLISD